MDKPIVPKKCKIIRHLYCNLKVRANLDDKIERKEFFRIIGILYHIPRSQRNVIVKELKDFGIILDSDKLSFTINKNF